MRSETDGVGSAANDNVRIGSCQNRTRFPAGTTAQIFRRARSATSSGAADTRCWRLTFRGPGGRFVEPVMGWTGSSDPLAGLELKFPTLESAIRYAQRQGLPFVVEGVVVPPAPKDVPAASVVLLKQAA
jgi:hypothetical protein